MTELTSVGEGLNEGSVIGESDGTMPSSSPPVGLAFGCEVGETDSDDVFDQRQMLVKSNRLTTRRFDMVELINGSSSTTVGLTSER